MTEATLSVQEVAKILKKDSQTVRVLLQQGLVSWGMAYKLPNSSHYSYLIYRNRLFDELGLNKEIDDQQAIKILDEKIEQLEKKIDTLNKDSEEYSNSMMELRSYERQREKAIWG